MHLCHSHDSHDGAEHHLCLDRAIEAAAKICAEKGERLTDARRRVLELVWAGHEAVKAYDIIARFNANGAPAKPPTVYRALEFLQRMGLVHRIECLNAFVGCPHPETSHDSHFFICAKCHSVLEMDATDFQKTIEMEARSAGFEIHRKSLEVQGLCANCH